jgi:hypothetical protein
MKRHSFDLTSFVFGVVLASAAGGFLLAEQLSWDVDGRWVLPIALILLGVAGVAGALSGIRPTRRAEQGETPDVEAGLAPDEPASERDVSST